MASGVPTFKLNNGVTAPAVGTCLTLLYAPFVECGANCKLQGIGCWAGLDQTEREKSKDWILAALKVCPALDLIFGDPRMLTLRKNGYRRIDTAYVYG